MSKIEKNGKNRQRNAKIRDNIRLQDIPLDLEIIQYSIFKP